MTSKTLTLTRVEYDQITDGVNALHVEIKRLTGIAWEHGNRADAAEIEVDRLRAALTDLYEKSQAWWKTDSHAQERGETGDPWTAVEWINAIELPRRCWAERRSSDPN